MGVTPKYVHITLSGNTGHVFNIYAGEGIIHGLDTSFSTGYSATALDSTNFYAGNTGDENRIANTASSTYYWVAWRQINTVTVSILYDAIQTVFHYWLMVLPLI